MHCPLCHSTHHFELQRTVPLSSDEEMVKLFLAQEGQSMIFNACCHCGLIFRSPRPTYEQLNQHYTYDLPPLESSIMARLGVTEEQAAEREIYRFRETFDQVQRFNNKKNGFIVDVGGRDGSSLLPWLNEGWQTTLIDTGVGLRPAINPSIRQADKIQNALALPDSMFDIITSYHCIEHLLDIKTSLSEMSLLSGPTTLWVIEVPFDVLYINGLLSSIPLSQPQIHTQHLNFFTPQSLSFVAQFANLRVLALHMIVVLQWFGPTVAIRLYACDQGYETRRSSNNRFENPEAFRRFLTFRLPFWRRWVGLKFRYYSYRTPLA